MSNHFAVLLDDAVQLEFDRDTPVPAQQLAYLDHMDARMADGVVLDGEAIGDPDDHQLSQFVAANMAQALIRSDDKTAIAMCTWLGVRRPNLLQVKIMTGELGLKIDLDYENPYEKPRPASQPVTFHPRRDIN